LPFKINRFTLARIQLLAKKTVKDFCKCNGVEYLSEMQQHKLATMAINYLFLLTSESGTESKTPIHPTRNCRTNLQKFLFKIWN